MTVTPQNQAQKSESGEIPASVAERERTLILVVYACQVLSYVFVFTLLVGIIINLIKRHEMTTDFAKSHMSWQLRTGLWTVAWSIVGFVLAFVLIGFPILLVVIVWSLYRIIRGCLAYYDGKLVGQHWEARKTSHRASVNESGSSAFNVHAESAETNR